MPKAATSDPRNAAVTETQLNDISEEVGNCWWDVGLRLGFSAAIIENIDEEKRGNRRKAFAILIRWKREEGRNATVGKLADVLEEMKRKDIAEKLLGLTSSSVEYKSEPRKCNEYESSALLYDDDNPEEEIVEEIVEESDEEHRSEAKSTLTAAGGALSVSRRNVVAQGEYDNDSFEDDSEDEEREDDRTEPKSEMAGSGSSDEEDKDLVQCFQLSGSSGEADSGSVSSHHSFSRIESDNERNSEYSSDGDKDDETSAGNDYYEDDSDSDWESHGHGDNHDDCDPNYTQNSGRGCFSPVEQEEQWKKEDPPRDESDERNSLKKERTTERTERMPFGVDADVMKYIYSSKYKAHFDCFLEDKEISHFEWKSGDTLAYIKCHKQKRDECFKALHSFLSYNVQKREIPIKEVFWDCVKAKLPRIRSNLGNTNQPIIKIIETERKLQIVSYISDIDQHYKCLKGELEKIIKEVQTAIECETFSFTLNYDPKDIFLLLKKINFTVKHLQPMCKDVEVIFNEEKGEIRLLGPKAQLDTAKETFEMQEIVIVQKKLQSHFSTYVLEFLKAKEVLEVVERTFQQKEIEAIVLFDETSPGKALSARVLGHAEEAIACIRELVAKKEVIVEDSDLRLTTTTEWLELCNNLRSEEGVFLQVGSSKNIYVVTGFAGKVANAVKRLQEFLCKNCKVDGNYECRTESIREYIEEYCQEELLLIETSLEEFGVYFKEGENRMLYMAGRRKGLELAKTKLDELTNSLVLRCFEERQPGLRKYVEENRRGKRGMETVEHKHKCVIKVERFSEIVQGTCCFVTSEGRSISCKIGDIVSEKVHTVVCPRGECTEAVLSTTCPAARPYSESLKNGQVSVSPGFNLPCKKVFFTKCSKWKGGDGEKCLRVVVRKSLEEVDKLKGTSIAFPATGTGKLEFPPAEAARIVLDETISFFGEYPATTVRDVRFILLRKNEEVIDAFTQGLNRYQETFGENKEQKHIASPGIQSGCRRSIKMQHINVEVVHGDLTNEESDAIVNIINSDMDMENAGDVSKAIARVCGESLKQECRQLGTQQAGSVVITSGGRLKARHIIHIIPASSEPRHLQMCLEKCLEHADSRSFYTVSLPAIGPGEYELPPLISADLIFGALTRFSKRCANLKNVRLVVNEAAMVDAFRQGKTKYKNSSTAAVSTKSKNYTLRFSLIGKDKESVDCAVEELKNDFSETCITKGVRDAVHEEFTAAEINMLVRKAENMEVEMTFEEVIDCVTLRGIKEDVFEMTDIIRGKIDQVKKREKERQNQENAKLISNTIQWFHALPRGDNIPFDTSANLEIERAYCKCDDKVEVVDSSGQKFKISFQDNSSFKQPQNQQINVTRKLKGAEGIPLPQHWDQMPRDDRDVHLVSLPKNSPEFGEVSHMFFATVEGVAITSIERIQNPWLYRTYILTKEKVDKNNGGKNERRLFHATSFRRVKLINSQGFKRNQNEEHGSRYGKGVYFARDASKSLPYADPAGGPRYMYLARVLFGRYCQGGREMKAPPPINSTESLYDSTVDKPVDPEIFVIFHDTQCYPEYLITFK